MAQTIFFYTITVDIDFNQGFEGNMNRSEIIMASAITIELSLFLMTLVCHKYDEAAQGRVPISRYEVVNETDVENFNNL
jgi:hypothetical protein